MGFAQGFALVGVNQIFAPGHGLHVDVALAELLELAEVADALKQACPDLLLQVLALFYGHQLLDDLDDLVDLHTVHQGSLEVLVLNQVEALSQLVQVRDALQ